MPPTLRIFLRRFQLTFRRRRKPLWIFTFGYIFLLTGLSFIGDRGLIRTFKLWKESQRLQAENAALSEEIGRLRRDVRLFRSDLKTIERYAREELHLAGQNEILYIFR